MTNILILSNGDISQYFIRWLDKKRTYNLKYYINNNNLNKNLFKNFNFIDHDLTSFLKMKQIINDINFSMILIINEDIEESKEYIKNIKEINKDIRIVLVVNNGYLDGIKNIEIININQIISNHIYGYFPDVPLIAKDIGLGKGDIMEVIIPFFSQYTYRHIGSIPQKKWRISIIYRNNKQIIPNNATMIYPNDTLILIGNPIILESVYKTINQKSNLFPQPFGDNLYLILDMFENIDNNILYIKEAISLQNKIANSFLYIRVINISNLFHIKKIESFEKGKIKLLIEFNYNQNFEIIDFDIFKYNIGLIITNKKFIKNNFFKKKLYLLKKPIYIFGKYNIKNISNISLFIENKIYLESISNSIFALSEILNLKINLYESDLTTNSDYNSKQIIEHYNNLANIFNMKINYEKIKLNPIIFASNKKQYLYVLAFDKSILKKSIFQLISIDISYFIYNFNKSPKLLIPTED